MPNGSAAIAASGHSPPSPAHLGELDVVVVGGGPAGSCCALALRTHAPDLRVALVEASDYEQPRLGENVSSALLKLLDYVDAREVFIARSGHLENVEVQACWGRSEAVPQQAMRHWSGEGFLLDRNRFDPMLAELFHDRGGQLFLQCRVESITPREAGQGYRLLLRHRSGARFSLSCRFLVDATGRKASIARRLGAGSPDRDDLIGISRTFELDPDTRSARDLLIESVAEGWWYSAPLPDNRRVVTLMTDAAIWQSIPGEPIHHWQALLAAAPQTSSRLRHSAVAADPALTIRPAYSRCLQPVCDQDWLAVGDAAASFDPLSSLGIGFAIHSAFQAARALHGALVTGDRAGLLPYSEAVSRQFEHYLPAWQAYYRYERRYAEAAFWQAAHRRFASAVH